MHMDLKNFLNEQKGDLSYREYADALGMHFATLHRFMSGKAELTVPNVRSLATAARRSNDLKFVRALLDYVWLGENK